MFRGLPIVISCYFGDSVLAGMPGMLSAVLFFSSIDILLKGVKGALVDDLQETVEMAQGTLQFVRLNQVVPLGICQFIEIHDAHTSVRIDNDICEKIGENVGIDAVFQRPL